MQTYFYYFTSYIFSVYISVSATKHEILREQSHILRCLASPVPYKCLAHSRNMGNTLFVELVFYKSALVQHKEQDTMAGLNDTSPTGYPVQVTTSSPHLRPSCFKTTLSSGCPAWTCRSRICCQTCQRQP